VQIRSSLESTIQEVQSGEEGRFDFDHVPPRPFLLTSTGEGFHATLSHTLRPGESYVVPPITMPLATVVTEVRVSPSIEEIAQEEFKDLEQPRVRCCSNFYDKGSGTKRSRILYAVSRPFICKGAINAGCPIGPHCRPSFELYIPGRDRHDAVPWALIAAVLVFLSPQMTRRALLTNS
jgi:hypothetical protein